MTLVGIEPTISSGKRPQTYVLDRAATGTGHVIHIRLLISTREQRMLKTVSRKECTKLLLKAKDWTSSRSRTFWNTFCPQLNFAFQEIVESFRDISCGVRRIWSPRRVRWPTLCAWRAPNPSWQSVQSDVPASASPSPYVDSRVTKEFKGERACE